MRIPLKMYFSISLLICIQSHMKLWKSLFLFLTSKDHLGQRIQMLELSRDPKMSFPDFFATLGDAI